VSIVALNEDLLELHHTFIKCWDINYSVVHLWSERPETILIPGLIRAKM